MKKDRIAFLQKYINEQGLDRKKNSAILCDNMGKIISLAGFSYDIGLNKPPVGSNIDEFHPVFSELFPIDEDVIVLPNIETRPGIFWDIHVLQGKRLSWVIFEDKTNIVSRYRQEIQDRNSLQFLDDQRRQKDECSQLIGLLDMVVLRKTQEGQWKRVNETPAWYQEFFNPAPGLISDEDIINAFPFLEDFLTNSPGSSDHPVFSGIWTEKRNDLEYHFRAQALNYFSSNILVIKKLHSVFDLQQEVFQQARDQSLVYEELKKSAQLAMELNRTKEQFISIISHDLRSPFISIISALDYLFDDQEFLDVLKAEQHEFLEYIQEEAKRLLDYLEKLLDWSRLDTGKLKPAIQDVDLHDLLALSRTQFEQRMADKNLHLELSIPENLIIKADSTLFSQAINNLIGNAIKFTPKGGFIYITAISTESKQEIRIRDTGVGIPQDKMEKLFLEHEKYYTYGTEGEKGSGLGLSITKKILDAHDFKLQCHSEPEKGTEFVIVL